MSEYTPTPQFETLVRQSFGAPEVRPEFANDLYHQLMQQAQTRTPRRRLFGLQPGWAITLMAAAVILIGTLAIGPAKVAGAFQRLFSYIPGIGVVEQSSNLRILEAPASLTQEDITVSVTEGLLTEHETRLEYGVVGVPLSAYEPGEAVTGCIEQPYLLLPDGTEQPIWDPIPAEVDRAIFVMPCIFNTQPGTVPAPWALPLRFIPAPPDFTVLPVTDVPLPTPEPTQSEIEAPAETETEAPAPEIGLSVSQVIQTETGYILLGYIYPTDPTSSFVETMGGLTLTDAAGNEIEYNFPQDIQRTANEQTPERAMPWEMEFAGAGLQFPLTIGMDASLIQQAAPDATASLTVDVGTNPQPGQVWELNQEAILAGQPVILQSLTATEQGYRFAVDPGEAYDKVSVKIENANALGAGGGGPWGEPFTTSVMYDPIPTGLLTIVFSSPLTLTDTQRYETTWQPEEAGSFTPVSTPAAVCLENTTPANLPLLPAELTGTALFTRTTPQMEIVTAALDGSQSRVLAPDTNRPGLSADGSMVAYFSEADMVIEHLASGEQTRFPSLDGYLPRWSPDGTKIAYIHAAVGIEVIDVNQGEPMLLSNLGYESIAGWSPDSSTLYYAVPGISDEGFQLRAASAAGGESKDIFTLEGSSRKAPSPAISPDGQWIAYRGADPSDVYLKAMDGSPARLLLHNPDGVSTFLVWDNTGKWLGISFQSMDGSQKQAILLAPNSCEAYQLPGLDGDVNGLYLP